MNVKIEGHHIAACFIAIAAIVALFTGNPNVAIWLGVFALFAASG